jgi:uncharacterized protein (DUF2342 family)
VSHACSFSAAAAAISNQQFAESLIITIRASFHGSSSSSSSSSSSLTYTQSGLAIATLSAQIQGAKPMFYLGGFRV